MKSTRKKAAPARKKTAPSKKKAAKRKPIMRHSKEG